MDCSAGIDEVRRNSNIPELRDQAMSQSVGRNENRARSRGVKRKEAFSPDRVLKSEVVTSGLDEDADPDEDPDRDAADEDDDDDEESPGRGETSNNFDLERLKAFNVNPSNLILWFIHY